MILNSEMNLAPHLNMYYQYDFDDYQSLNEVDVNNKLFCTFTSYDEIDSLIRELTSVYSILYNKIFILDVKSNDEFALTYNVDQGNVNIIPDNTILVHRKKETNTLYTINALNELIKKLNSGIVDKRFPIEWQHYRNSVLLTQKGDFKQLNTKIYKIIEL